MAEAADLNSPPGSPAVQNPATMNALSPAAEQELLAARQALRETQERLSAVFNQAAVGIAVANLDGRFEQVNQRFLEIVGHSMEAIQDRTIEDITYPDDVPQTRVMARRLLSGELTEHAYEKRFVRPDGSCVWSLTNVTLLKDSAGKPRKFIGVVVDISQRKAAQLALQTRERELSLIYSSVSDALFSVGVEPGMRYRFVSVNPAFLAVTGLAAEQVVGRLVEQIIPPPSLAMALEQYAAAIRERRTVRWEETSIYPAGTKTGLVSVTPIFDSAGTCVNLIGTVHDISERKHEEEFRARLAAVVESSDDAIVSKTLEGIITTWNKGAQRMFGYTSDEVVGKSITILIPPDRISEEDTILQRLKRGERIEHYETVRLRKDGTPLDISLSISPIAGAGGKLVGASKIARDITARKRMEAALRDESRVLELLNQTGSAIASQLDLQALVQTVTDAGTQLSGARLGAFFYNPSKQDGSFHLCALSGVSRDTFKTLEMPRNMPFFESIFHGKTVVRSPDITQDPRYREMSLYFGVPTGDLPVRSYLAVPVISRSGEVIGGLFFGHPETNMFSERSERLMIGIAAQAALAMDNARLYEDVRAAAAEREQLLEAERAARGEAERVSLLKDEFLATLSHELRTPLNAILGWSQVLLSRGHVEEELTEGLNVIERNARVQTQLIEDLLDMSRIISGKLRLEVQRVEVQDIIKAAVASVRHSAEAKGIRLQVVLDPLAEPVRGDPARLQQCFWNLLSNAIKFTQRGGAIQISLQRLNSHIEIDVADNGQGIKPEFLPHLFERFRQADASTTRRHSGLGLGLSIVKNLIELHGGRIRARSAGEGQGSTFTVELPVMVVQTSPAVRHHFGSSAGSYASTYDTDHSSLKGIRVLAVDDEADARDLLKRVLEDCGATVMVSASSREALELIARQPPDMIISDIGMPDEDGYDFIRKVRALSPEEGGRTPAAALTAFARAEDRTRALRAGYQTHVSKPVEPTELAAVVASLAIRR